MAAGVAAGLAKLPAASGGDSGPAIEEDEGGG
jgi:hypothetical protein